MPPKPERSLRQESPKPKFDIRLLGTALAAYAAFNTYEIASDTLQHSSHEAQLNNTRKEQTSLVQTIQTDSDSVAILDQKVKDGKTLLAKSQAQGEALDLQSKVNRQQVEVKNLNTTIKSLELKVLQYPEDIRWKSILAVASAALSITAFTIQQKADYKAASKALRDSELSPEQRRAVEGFERLMDE
jgi:hypothetical protein